MPYRAAKISFDGSHYIATPKENFPQGHKRRRTTIPPTLKRSKRKNNLKPPTRRARSFRAKSAKPICGRLWRKLFPIRSSGKNTSSGTTSGKRQMPFAEKCDLPRKVFARNGVSFARLRSRTRCIRKRVSGNRSAIRSNTLSPAKAGNMSAYGSAAEKRQTAFPRYLLYSAGRNGRRDRRNKGLQYQRPPNADGAPEHLFSRTVRAKRFSSARLADGSTAFARLSDEVHREVR